MQLCKGREEICKPSKQDCQLRFTLPENNGVLGDKKLIINLKIGRMKVGASDF